MKLLCFVILALLMASVMARTYHLEEQLRDQRNIKDQGKDMDVAKDEEEPSLPSSLNDKEEPSLPSSLNDEDGCGVACH